jgi:hypothetical protein
VAANAATSDWSQLKDESAKLRAKLVNMRQEQDENKQIELLRKQLDEQQKIIQALVEHAKKQPLADDARPVGVSLGIAPLPRDVGDTQIQMTAAQLPAPREENQTKQAKQIELLQKQLRTSRK